MKKLKFNKKNVSIEYTKYRNNGTLAVIMHTALRNKSYWVITVNLDSSLQSDRLAFVDENNLPGIGQWLQENSLAYPLGYSQRSGFCTYPLYSFHIPSMQ